ncbi:MAG: protein-export chaperone SecB [Gammaproteobacteria bacterium]|jgi:preprotein translocase subunit SecB|nr:protein-export chaperone SecB [Gammaproteobacteria bacterium]
MNDKKAESNGNGANSDQPQFALQQIYMKDLSFEAPKTPTTFSEQQVEPEIKLNLKNSHTTLATDTYEIVLHVSVHATMKESTLFLVEIDQAGVFFIKGYPPDELSKLIGTYCPTTLFPYVRETISSTIGKGGFPSMLLQPINFDALYAQASQESSQN